MTELPSEYHRRLPYGERMSADPLLGRPFFPFEGDVQVVPLPSRSCRSRHVRCGRWRAVHKCTEPDGFVIWRRRAVALKTGFEPAGCRWSRCSSRASTTGWTTCRRS